MQDLLISSNYLPQTTIAILSRSHLRLPHHRKPSHFQKLLVKGEKKKVRDLELRPDPKVGFYIFGTKSYGNSGFFWVEGGYMLWRHDYVIFGQRCLRGTLS